MARPHRTFGRSGGATRQVTWVAPADQGYVAVAAGTAVILSSFDANVNNMPKPTIVRTRGVVSVKPAVGTDIEIVGAIGVGIVSDEAFTAGVASIPGPWSEADWDGWFVWRSFAFSQTQLDATGSLLNSIQIEIDSKAMRKQSENYTMVTLAESQAAAFEISTNLRTLFKLS